MKTTVAVVESIAVERLFVVVRSLAHTEHYQLVPEMDL